MTRANVEAKILIKKDIEELSKKRGNNDTAFSLYVGVKAGRNFVSEANSAISGAVQKIKNDKSYTKKTKRETAETANKIKKEIRLLKLPDETRSIAIFCSLKGMHKIYRLPVYVPSRFVVEPDFYIHPLVKALEKYPRYLVAFLERDKARFFSIFLGEIEESSEVLRSEVPQRINAGRAAWKGLRETRVQSHIEDHINKHLKKVADKTNDYFRYGKTKFDYLIVGTHKELAERFIKILGGKAKDKLIGSYQVVPGYKLNRIKEKSKEIIDNHERKIEAEIVKDLFDKANKRKKMSAIEINSVLENFYLHNIGTLVISQSFKEQGYVCPKCHYISSYLKSCPNCKEKMSKISDIADELIEEATVRGIKIKHLFYSNAQFDKFGIGAFLKSAV